MANRVFRPLKGALDNGLCLLAGSWAIGGTGAVGTKTGGVGMTLSRNSAGNYTVTFDDAFQSLLGFSVTPKTSADLTTRVASWDVSSDSKTVVFVMQTGTTATDPSSGDQLFVTAVLKDSGV